MTGRELIVLVGGPNDGAKHSIDAQVLRDVLPQFHLLPEPQLTLGGRGGEQPIRPPVVEHYELLRDPHGLPSWDDAGRLRFGWRGAW